MSRTIALVALAVVVPALASAGLVTVDLSTYIQDVEISGTTNLEGATTVQASTDSTFSGSSPGRILVKTSPGLTSLLPAGARVAKMQLHLKAQNSKAPGNLHTLVCDRALKAWVVTEAHKDSASASLAWSRASADERARGATWDAVASSATHDRVASLAVDVPNGTRATGDWAKFDLTYYANQVMRGTWTDNGWIICFNWEGEVGFTQKFHSIEAASSADRPVLTVTYEVASSPPAVIGPLDIGVRHP